MNQIEEEILKKEIEKYEKHIQTIKNTFRGSGMPKRWKKELKETKQLKKDKEQKLQQLLDGQII